MVCDLGLESELIEASSKAVHRYVMRRGKLVALPQSPGQFLRSGVMSLRGRLRVLLEPRQKAPGSLDDESVGDFGRRRLGSEAVESLLDPLVTGIFGGDVARLSVRSAFPRIAEMEAKHGSLFRAMKAKHCDIRRRQAHAALVASPDSRHGCVELHRHAARWWSDEYRFCDGRQELANLRRLLASRLRSHVREPLSLSQHNHRLIMASVGFLIILSAFFLFRIEGHRRETGRTQRG